MGDISNLSATGAMTRPARIQIPGLAGAPHHRAGAIGPIGPQMAPRSAQLGAVQQNDTLGWDTVFAVPVPEVNAQFAASKAYPESFNYTLTGSVVTATIAGTFGAWQSTTGGSGGILRMSLPIATGTLTPQGGTAIDMSGGSLVIDVNLIYVPQPALQARITRGATAPNGTPYGLTLDTAGQAGLQPVTVLSVDLPSTSAPDVLATAQAAFQAYLNANLSAFTYIFNTVNLNMVADKDSYQWLKPTYCSYAYHDAATVDAAVFGVLCMVLGNQPGTAANQLGPMAIPAGAQSGFSVSEPLFMEQMLLPGLPVSFGQGTDPSYFKLLPGDTTIVSTKNIPTAPVTYAGTKYYPEIEQFQLWIDADMICIHSKVHCHISPGIDAYFEQTSYLSVQLVTKPDGTFTIGYTDAAPPNQNHWVDVASWITITEVIVAMLGAIVTTLVGAAANTTARIVIACVIAVVMGVAAVTPTLVADIQASGVADNLPSVEALITDMSNPVSWPGGTSFTPTLAQVNGTFQFGGNAFPPSS
jgi:hypothetical protein